MPTSIGLDIGSSAVRAAQVITSARRGSTLERVGQVLLPPGAVRDGEIHDPDTVADALRQLWSRYRFSSRKVALGVASQQVVVRPIELPWLPAAQLRESLPFTASEYIPMPVEDAILDFHTVDDYINEAGERMRRVVLVAAHRNLVTSLVDTVRLAKLDPVLIDLEAFALLRSVAEVGLLDGDDAEVLVDIGANVTNIVVHRGGAPSFVRILLMGGNAITEGLISSLDLSFEDAEAAKATIGLETDWGGHRAASEIIASRAARFIDEIRGSVNYYQSQPGAARIRGVVLSGGAGQLPYLADRLSEALKLPVEDGFPMQQLRLGKLDVPYEELVEAQHFLSVAIGLAMTDLAA